MSPQQKINQIITTATNFLHSVAVILTVFQALQKYLWYQEGWAEHSKAKIKAPKSKIKEISNYFF